MIHHLASLPWPWLVICGATLVAAAPELRRWIAHEKELARRTRAIRSGVGSDRGDYKSAPCGASPVNHESAPSISSAAAPLPAAAEAHPASRRT